MADESMSESDKLDRQMQSTVIELLTELVALAKLARAALEKDAEKRK